MPDSGSPNAREATASLSDQHVPAAQCEGPLFIRREVHGHHVVEVKFTILDIRRAKVSNHMIALSMLRCPLASKNNLGDPTHRYIFDPDHLVTSPSSVWISDSRVFSSASISARGRGGV